MMTVKEFASARTRLNQVNAEFERTQNVIRKNVRVIENSADIEAQKLALESALNSHAVDTRRVEIESATRAMANAVAEAIPVAERTIRALHDFCEGILTLRKLAKAHQDGRNNFSRARTALALHGDSIVTPQVFAFPVNPEKLLQYIGAKFRINGNSRDIPTESVYETFPKSIPLPREIQEEEPLECGE